MSLRSSIVEPDELSHDERAQLAHRLFQVHHQIFDGLDEAGFAEYVVNPRPGVKTEICLYHNPEGELVGYSAFHVVPINLRGRPGSVVRMEAGILPAYRHSGIVMLFSVRCLFKYRLLSLFPRSYFLGCFIHPIIYRQLMRTALDVAPSRKRVSSAEHVALVSELAAAFQMPPWDAERPWLRDTGWIVRQDAETTARLAASEDPDIRYFIEQNPHYLEGVGLLLVAPCTAINVLVCAFKTLYYSRKAIRRQLRRWFPAATVHGLSEPAWRRLRRSALFSRCLPTLSSSSSRAQE